MSSENPYEKQAELQRTKPRVRTPKIPNANSKTLVRRNKKGTTVHFNLDTHTVLKLLAIEEQKTLNDLLLEGVNLMLQHYGRKPIA